MKNKWVKRLGSKKTDEAGAVIVMVAIVLIVLIAIAALAVDVGYLMASRNELQNAADASALAATRRLGSIYASMSNAAQASYVCNPGDIVPVAQAAASSNMAAGQSVAVLASDVEIGQWIPPPPGTLKGTLNATLNQPNAVRVTTRRDPSVAADRVGTFFARIFNIDSVSVTAVATAALSGLTEIKEGEIDLPIGISDTWFKTFECGKAITFYPTQDSCAGWTNWTNVNNNKVSDNDLKNNILPGLIDGSLTAPGAKYWETTWWFTGGNLSQPTWTKLDELFQQKAVDGQWVAHVVVYHYSKDSADSCANPVPGADGPLVIVGFATITLTQVVVPPSVPGGAPQKSLVGAVECTALDGRGSGGYYGTWGTIPGLVE